MATPANKTPVKTLAIIGGGRVGKTLGRLFAEAGIFNVTGILNRSLASAQAAADFIGAGTAHDDVRTLGKADIYMITTGDKDIAAACAVLLEAGLVSPGTIVFHGSGAHSAAILSAAKQHGGFIGSAHPVKSFSDPAAAIGNFAGTFCGLEGDAEALTVLEDAFSRVGARPFAINGAEKTLYHAGAVIACNYLYALMEWSFQTYEQAGVSRDIAAKILEPIVTDTVGNLFRTSPAAALTGPIARGDYDVVKAHHDAIKDWRADYAALYARMGLVTLELAAAQGNAAQSDLEDIHALLSADTKTP